MKYNNRLIFLLLILLVFNSCKEKEDLLINYQNDIISNKEDISFINERYKEKIIKDYKNLVYTKSIGEIDYKIRYVSIVEQIIRNVDDADSSNIINIINDYKETEQYNIRFKLNNSPSDIIKYNLNNLSEYDSRINYLANEFKYNFYLVSGNDTLLPKLYHFERIFGLSNYCTFLLHFERTSDDKDKILIIEDGVFGGSIIKIRLKLKELGYL